MGPEMACRILVSVFNCGLDCTMTMMVTMTPSIVSAAAVINPVCVTFNHADDAVVDDVDDDDDVDDVVDADASRCVTID